MRFDDVGDRSICEAPGLYVAAATNGAEDCAVVDLRSL
jgi:hypothetical protein